MNLHQNKRILYPLLNLLFYNSTILKRGSLNFTAHRRHYMRNPLEKRRKFIKSQRDSKEITRIWITILGNGALGQPRCIGLFTDYKGILFNCGEGVGRALREHEACFHEIKHVFVTKREWNNISGLADIHLTHEAYGIYKLNLFGPPGVEHVKSIITGETSTAQLRKKDTPYVDEAFEIKSISITANQLNSRKVIQSVEDIVYSYSCKILERQRELCPAKLIECNVPFGPHLKKLKDGEDVVLSSGRIIRSDDVINLTNKENYLLIVDCPSKNFLLPFVTKGEFSRFQLPLNDASLVSTVFHFSPPHIMKTKLYQDWMKRFHPDTQHVVLNTSCPSISSNSVYQSQSIFHQLHPDIFKLLPDSKVKGEDNFGISNILHAPPMLELQYRPLREENWSNVVDYMPKKFIQESQNSPDFVEELNKLKTQIEFQSQAKHKDIQEYPEVIFFGTSSATSTAYRNVTAILTKISDDKSILLDCGEGTFMQLVRYFGTENIDTELQNISCIFVSHLHTDHYLGIFQVINSRAEAFHKTGCPYKPLAVVLPYKIREIFKQYSMLYDQIIKKVKIFTMKSLAEGNNERFHEFIGDIQVQTFDVRHCNDAHGVAIKKDGDWTIVYSGDSAPCQKIIDVGQNCTLLIHEASIEDGCQTEAMIRKHSTPMQVIDIAEKMNAQHTIMTHFSKRYLAVPVFEDTDKKNVGCAFDFMKVKLHQLPLVPLFLPAMQCLFRTQLLSHAQRTSFYVNFEHSFLKSFTKLKASSRS